MPVHEKLYIQGDTSDKASERIERSATELTGHLGVGDIRRTAANVPTTDSPEVLGADTTGTVARIAAPTLLTGAGAASTFTVTYATPAGATGVDVVVRTVNTTAGGGKQVYGKARLGASVATVTIAGVPANTVVEVEVFGVDTSGRAGRGRVGTVVTHA